MKGGVLKDLVFFVDVHSQDNPNGAQSIQSMVETLGGKVRKTLSQDITHIIFQNGKKSTLTKVQNRPEVKMVSVLWVDKCKETQKIPLESDFPACAEVGPKKKPVNTNTKKNSSASSSKDNSPHPDQGNNDEKNEQDDHVFSFPDGPDDHSNEKQLQNQAKSPNKTATSNSPTKAKQSKLNITKVLPVENPEPITEENLEFSLTPPTYVPPKSTYKRKSKKTDKESSIENQQSHPEESSTSTSSSTKQISQGSLNPEENGENGDKDKVEPPSNESHQKNSNQVEEKMSKVAEEVEQKEEILQEKEGQDDQNQKEEPQKESEEVVKVKEKEKEKEKEEKEREEREKKEKEEEAEKEKEKEKEKKRKLIETEEKEKDKEKKKGRKTGKRLIKGSEIEKEKEKEKESEIETKESHSEEIAQKENQKENQEQEPMQIENSNQKPKRKSDSPQKSVTFDLQDESLNEIQGALPSRSKRQRRSKISQMEIDNNDEKIQEEDISESKEQKKKRKSGSKDQESENNPTPTKKLRAKEKLQDEPKENGIQENESGNDSEKENKENSNIQKSPDAGVSKTGVIIVTGASRSIRDIVTQTTKHLGNFRITTKFNQKLLPTHVICEDNKRTLSVLYGIVHNCWILKPEWVMTSLEKGYWVDEKDFLSPDFAISHAHRENNEKANQAKIMKSSPEIYVGEETLGNVSDITSLIKLCGGKIVDSITSSAICLGTVKDQLNCQRVKEQWLYDCISNCKELPVQDYLLNQPSLPAAESPEY